MSACELSTVSSINARTTEETFPSIELEAQSSSVDIDSVDCGNYAFFAQAMTLLYITIFCK